MVKRRPGTSHSSRGGSGRGGNDDVQMRNSGNGGSSRQNLLTCNHCGQTGHKARDCQQQQRCSVCKKIGHTAENCRWNQTNQQSNGNNSNQNKYQGSKNDASHSGQKNSQNTNSRVGSADHKKQAPTTLPMAGFTFANCIPSYSGNEPYCPTCNNTSHVQRSCPNPHAVGQLQYSILVCWRCGFRGHTGDECQHPCPSTQTNICGICHKAGHTTEKCSNELQKKFNAATNTSDANRFFWGNVGNFKIMPHPTQQRHVQVVKRLLANEAQGYMLTPEREACIAQELAVDSRIDFGNQGQQADAIRPQFTTPAPVRRPSPLLGLGVRKMFSPQATPPTRPTVPDPSPTGSNGWAQHPFQSHQTPHGQDHTHTQPNHHHHLTTDPNRLAALRAHATNSSTLYPRENYSRKIHTNMSVIQSHRLLSSQAAWHLSAKIAQGVQFWRDPRAMESIIMKQKAICYTCQTQGVYLDKNMCGVADRDPLTVEDGKEWGVFVMFDCRCCDQGFGYVPAAVR